MRDYCLPEMILYKHYYPFGAQMEGRHGGTSDYRYGMNGQEHENEITNSPSHYSAEYWMYDARLGRRWNNDPITYPWQSPYAAFNNNPVYFADPLGLEGIDPETAGAKAGAAAEPVAFETTGATIVVTGKAMTEAERNDFMAKQAANVLVKSFTANKDQPTGFWLFLDKMDYPSKYRAADRTWMGGGSKTTFSGTQYMGGKDDPNINGTASTGIRSTGEDIEKDASPMLGTIAGGAKGAKYGGAQRVQGISKALNKWYKGVKGYDENLEDWGKSDDKPVLNENIKPKTVIIENKGGNIRLIISSEGDTAFWRQIDIGIDPQKANWQYFQYNTEAEKDELRQMIKK